MGSSCFKEPLSKTLRKTQPTSQSQSQSGHGKCINHTWDSKKYLLSEERVFSTCPYYPNHIEMEHISRANHFYNMAKSGKSCVTLENVEICIRNLNKCKENIRHYNYCVKDKTIGIMEQLSRNEELMDLYLIIIYFNHLAIKNYGPSENFLKGEKIKKNNQSIPLETEDVHEVHEVVGLEEEVELKEISPIFGSEGNRSDVFVSDSRFIGRMSSNHGMVGSMDNGKSNNNNNRNNNNNNTEKLALLYMATTPPVHDPNNDIPSGIGGGNNNNDDNNGATPEFA